MKNKYLLVIITILLLSTEARSQAPAFRGIYLDGFRNILGNTVKEDSVLQYASDSSFNYIALYDLQTINFNNSTSVNQLASFIRKARETYGIASIGAVGESYTTFLNKIAPYNNSRTNVNEKFNVFNLEFEFWTTSSVNPGGAYCTAYLQPNGCSCDSSGGFKFFISNMHLIDSLATTQGAISETYVGWFNQGQGSQIQRNVNRILLHAYRTDPSSVYGYSKTRLQYLASNNSVVNVAPIFSNESIFMGPWLNTHQQSEAFTKYKSDFQADNSSFVQYINMLGYQWFDYGYMPKPAPGTGTTTSTFTPTIAALGATTFCQGESVTLTAGGGTGFQWSNGATTSSITVNNPGNYNCRVTNNGSSQYTPDIIVTVNASPTVTITQGTLTNNQIPITSNADPMVGTVQGYQWKLNNNSISGSMGSTYTATASGDYSVVLTNTMGCSTTSNSVTCSVPTPASCSLTVPGSLTATAESNTAERLTWGVMPASDSIVIRYKPETSQIYRYITLPNIGQVTLVITGLTPNTKYQWRIKTVCGTTSSSYSGKRLFTTLGFTNIPYQTSSSSKSYVYTESDDESDMIIFPNPASESVRLSYFSNQETVSFLSIMDMNGRVVKSQEIPFIEGDNEIRIETVELESGIYFLQIKNDQATQTQRLMISK